LRTGIGSPDIIASSTCECPSITGPDLDPVADLDVGQRHVGDHAVTHAARRLRLQADQPADRGTCPAATERLEVSAREDQRDDDDGRLVVDVGSSGRQQVPGEGRDDRVSVGAQRADRHERVHVGRAPQQVGQALGVEAQAGSEKHDRRKDEESGIEPAMPEQDDDPVVDRRDGVSAHLDDENRGREDGRHDRRAAQGIEFGRLRILHAIGGSLVRDKARVVAGPPGGSLDGTSGKLSDIRRDRRPLRREVHRHARDALDRSDRLLDARDARSAGHTGDGEFARLDGNFGTGRGGHLCLRLLP
jgi:hypothetical protein